jgi:hypothetical protein
MGVTEILVEEQGHRAALAFLAESFTRTPAQGVIRLSPSLYGNGWFIVRKDRFMPSIPAIPGRQEQSTERDCNAKPADAS